MSTLTKWLISLSKSLIPEKQKQLRQLSFALLCFTPFGGVEKVTDTVKFTSFSPPFPPYASVGGI